jgi:hypothetical protein
MTTRASYVSVVDPVSMALERVKTILFRPFDLGKWFTIGFCAWLAELGKKGGGGSGGGGGGGGSGPQGAADIGREITRAAEDATDFVAANLDWIIPVAIGILVVIVGLWLLVMWLSSRGRFMFLDCIAHNKAEVKNPWNQFRDHGNRLFGFRIALGVIGFLTGILFLVLCGIVIFLAATSFGWNVLSISGIVACGLLFFATMIVFGLIAKFTTDFAVPIMYLHTSSPVEAWRALLDVLTINKARFFLYILFQMVIGIAIGVMVLATVCVTCCCAGCLFMIPYIGTVALLPVHVFTRSYSLYYLAQYGPEFNVFPSATATTVPGGGPVA